jgi:hypothetical protein
MHHDMQLCNGKQYCYMKGDPLSHCPQIQKVRL